MSGPSSARRGFTLASAAFAAGLALPTAPAHAGLIIDLINNSEGSVNSALFFRADVDPGGTGTFNSFVRVQHNNGGSNNGHSGPGREQGYNTSGRPVQYDELTDPNFTRDLVFGEIPIVTIEDVDYKEFILDINEPLGRVQQQLSIDQINVYTSEIGGQTGLESTLGTLRYSLGDFLNDNSVTLDASLTSGSGEGDMRLYIPLDNFAGVENDDFVYLYSHFGNLDGAHRTGGGFEEWGVGAIPSAGSLVLLFLAACVTKSRRREEAGQSAVGPVQG